MKIRIVGAKLGDAPVVKEFLTWLCEAGEQDYFTWVEERGLDRGVIRFAYDFKQRVVDCEIGDSELGADP
jgi:hypothetical protein